MHKNQIKYIIESFFKKKKKENRTRRHRPNAKNLSPSKRELGGHPGQCPPEINSIKNQLNFHIST